MGRFAGMLTSGRFPEADVRHAPEVWSPHQWSTCAQRAEIYSSSALPGYRARYPKAVGWKAL